MSLSVKVTVPVSRHFRPDGSEVKHSYIEVYHHLGDEVKLVIPEGGTVVVDVLYLHKALNAALEAK